MFIIDVTSKDPIFEQIKKQINRFIQLEVLKEDDRLPSVRSLALELGINPNTVAKAYQELEAEGIVYTLTKKGVFVAKREKVDIDLETVLSNFNQCVSECKSSGVEKKVLLDVIETIYKEGKANDQN